MDEPSDAISFIASITSPKLTLESPFDLMIEYVGKRLNE